MSVKSRLVYLLLFVMVVTIYVYQWFQPVSLPDVKTLKPEIIKSQAAISTQKWYNQLLKNNLWDPERGAVVVKNAEKSANKSSEQSKAAKKRVNWSLKGIVQNINGELVAVIDLGNKQSQAYRQGETLPNGELLNNILEDGIEISDMGQKRIYLFGKKSETDPGDL